MTVDHEKDTHPTDSPPDEMILTLLEEHKALPTTTVAAALDGSVETTKNQLQKMAKVGLIERRETVKGDVWLTW